MTENDGDLFQIFWKMTKSKINVLIFKHVLLFILIVFLAYFKVVKIIGICPKMSENDGKWGKMTENVVVGRGGGPLMTYPSKITYPFSTGKIENSSYTQWIAPPPSAEVEENIETIDFVITPLPTKRSITGVFMTAKDHFPIPKNVTKLTKDVQQYDAIVHYIEECGYGVSGTKYDRVRCK